MRRKAREYALQVLYALDLNPVPIEDFLITFWELNPSRPEIKKFTENLVNGTRNKINAIDTLISAHSSHWKITRMAVTDRNILRLATFELLEEPGVPSRVVINEAIEIAKKFGTEDSATFINGVLDSIHHALQEV